MHESDLLVTLDMDSQAFNSVGNAFRDYYAQSCDIWMVGNSFTQHSEFVDYNYRFFPPIKNENRNHDTAHWGSLQHICARHDHSNRYNHLMNSETRAEAESFSVKTVALMRDKHRTCPF